MRFVTKADGRGLPALLAGPSRGGARAGRTGRHRGPARRATCSALVGALLTVPIVYVLANATEHRAHRLALHRRTRGSSRFSTTVTRPIHHRIFTASDMAIRDRREAALVLLPWFAIVIIVVLDRAPRRGPRVPRSQRRVPLSRDVHVLRPQLRVASPGVSPAGVELDRAPLAGPAPSAASRNASSSAAHAEVELQRDGAAVGLGARYDLS